MRLKLIFAFTTFFLLTNLAMATTCSIKIRNMGDAGKEVECTPKDDKIVTKIQRWFNFNLELLEDLRVNHKLQLRAVDSTVDNGRVYKTFFLSD